ncbi:MAG: isoleucine--tRNA ligase [Chlamydiota bacterium]
MFENKNESFPLKEERILAFWQKENIFEKSLDNRTSNPLFSFYDGPPFATGLPHYGHILAATLKDVIPRYKTMKGFYVPRRFGWDCHGLPVENEIEKEKELSGAHAIESFGIANFNEECRSIVLRYTGEWKQTVDRMGRWVSFSDTYKTMDPSFMESVWWVFGQLYGKGLVYEGFKVMPFSTQLGTPLSNFEANLNYKDVDDPSLTVLFALEDEPDPKLLVWTTTPWTLPSNLAILVKKDLTYVKIKVKETGALYILAKGCINRYFPSPDQIEILEEFLGEALDQKRYEPLFPYFAERKENKAFRIITEDSLSDQDGTGLVHAAPAFGEVDFFACLRESIESVCPVDQNGRFTSEVPDFMGLYVKDADKEIIKRLKKEGKVLLHTQIRHRYPFCWRSDTPLIYKTVRTWFVAVEKIKDKMLKANEQIHWVPNHIKHGRFGKWLENARDWAISRNRYWGTPIPIWRSEDGEIRVISSIEQLETLTGQKITDLHRHFIDDLTFEEDGKIFRRIPEVFDCWFESGSMPYAQNHFPFENEEKTLNAFPADFIAEGLDQTRGWFYTLTVLAAALFDKPAFKHVIVNGIILAEDGNKMSKRLKNYPEPKGVFNKYGVDALRLYLMNSPAVYAEDLRFSEKDVELTLRQALIPLWNSFVFLSTYAKINNWTPKESITTPSADIDKWALSILQKLITEVTEAMDNYEINKAVTPLIDFVDQLTNWYIRRNRSRFWAEERSEDQDQAFETLYTVLFTFSKIAAPFIPFLTEEIYQELRVDKDPISIHLTDFPVANQKLRDESMERQMSFVQSVVSIGHSLRKENKIKVRQPLSKAHMIAVDSTILAALKQKEHLIAEELNVKELVYHEDESLFVQLIAKPNFRVLGKKVGSKMNSVQKTLEVLERSLLEKLLNKENIEIVVEGQTITLTPEDIAIERKVLEGVIAASLGSITVALDTALTPDLIEEGIAREFINKINTLRKELGFSITDRISLTIEAPLSMQTSFLNYKELICNEVLATKVSFQENLEGSSCDINGEAIIIALSSL